MLAWCTENYLTRLTRYRKRDDSRANFSAFNNQLRTVDPASVNEYTVTLDNDPKAEYRNDDDPIYVVSNLSLLEARRMAYNTPGSRTAESVSFLLVVVLSLRMIITGMMNRIRSLRIDMLELVA